ncbi:hypothetical protein HUH15_000794 [Salmonella enterica]|nr:hypothetical protein [Salmonella enterica]EHO4561175.1 hypothetical protein [Salmonella enterica subsp. enterica serovar Carrau]EEM0711666.1 hypothetical protein [Salmonella enterica]EFO7998189.1 hypothetical protein [Salmonella enterica]EFS6944384.1 hypothetical protein [Salmonella enterica]
MLISEGTIIAALALILLPLNLDASGVLRTNYFRRLTESGWLRSEKAH